MNIDLETIISTKIDEINKTITEEKQRLTDKCEERQKIGALKIAFLRYGIEDVETDRQLTDIEVVIEETKSSIIEKTKQINALYEYSNLIKNMQIKRSETQYIITKFPYQEVV